MTTYILNTVVDLSKTVHLSVGKYVWVVNIHSLSVYQVSFCHIGLWKSDVLSLQVMSCRDMFLESCCDESPLVVSESGSFLVKNGCCESL